MTDKYKDDDVLPVSPKREETDKSRPVEERTSDLETGVPADASPDPEAAEEAELPPGVAKPIKPGERR